MDTNKKITPQFFFVTLGMVVSLMVATIGFLNLAFSSLDLALPDALNAVYSYGYNSYEHDGVRTALALVIIAVPTLFSILRYFNMRVKKGLSHGDEVLRKWVIYGVLFLVALTAFVDIIVLVQHFVGGEITIRFLLKVLVTFATVSIVGAYFLALLRGEGGVLVKVLPYLSLVFTILAVVYAFSVIGSPSEQRNLRFDQTRVDDLRNIQSQVISFYQMKGQIPEELSDLKKSLDPYFSLPVDPEYNKGLSYEYEKVGDREFVLCATFSLPMPEGYISYDRGGYVEPYYGEDMASLPYPSIGEDSWYHNAGRTCYLREIDQDLYPVYKDDK